MMRSILVVKGTLPFFAADLVVLLHRGHGRFQAVGCYSSGSTGRTRCPIAHMT